VLRRLKLHSDRACERCARSSRTESSARRRSWSSSPRGGPTRSIASCSRR